jgi:ATP adenylyltransferase
LWALVDIAVGLVERAFRPQGVNVGLNQGRAAGAGLPEHLHVHVVPRWGGDTNFMATVGEVRVVPDSLEQSWRMLRTAIV